VFSTFCVIAYLFSETLTVFFRNALYSLFYVGILRKRNGGLLAAKDSTEAVKVETLTRKAPRKKMCEIFPRVSDLEVLIEAQQSY